MSAAETETRVLLAEGMLTWGRAERIGDRYGLVVVMCAGVDEYAALIDADYASFSAAGWLLGTCGTLVAEIMETRRSGHIGDMFHGFYPVTPEVGERVELGTGSLFVETAWDDVVGVGVRPADGRDTFWMDPPSLYRCHEQTVRLWFVPDEEVSANS